MANKRLSDLPAETDPASSDVLAVDGATTRHVTRANLLAANLEAIRGLTSAADKGIQFTGSGAAATYDLTTAGKALLDDADASAQRTTLGLAIGTDVQAYSAKLADIAGITYAQGDVLYYNGTNVVNLGPGTSGYFLKTQGAGANPVWDSLPGGGDLLSTNNLSDVSNSLTSLANLGGTTVGKAVFIATDAAAARVTLGIPTVIQGYISGLTTAWASTTTFTVAAGAATDSTNAAVLILASSITKSTSAWAVGSGNGGLDTGSIAASTWYHIYLIRRSDTGVVDVLFSTSASAPTMPANYDQSRWIGATKTNGSSQWVKWFQSGADFIWDVGINEANINPPGTSAITQTLTGVPTGVRVKAILALGLISGATGAAVLVTDLQQTDTTPTGFLSNVYTGASGRVRAEITVYTNTSAQVRLRSSFSDGSTEIDVFCKGWTAPL